MSLIFELRDKAERRRKRRSCHVRSIVPVHFYVLVAVLLSFACSQAGAQKTPDKLLFFTCGCDRCVSAATTLAENADQISDITIETVGAIPVTDLTIFNRKAGLKAQVRSDIGGHLHNRYGVADCPRMIPVDDQGNAIKTAHSNTQEVTTQSVVRLLADLKADLRPISKTNSSSSIRPSTLPGIDTIIQGCEFGASKIQSARATYVYDSTFYEARPAKNTVHRSNTVTWSQSGPLVKFIFPVFVRIKGQGKTTKPIKVIDEYVYDGRYTWRKMNAIDLKRRTPIPDVYFFSRFEPPETDLGNPFFFGYRSLGDLPWSEVFKNAKDKTKVVSMENSPFGALYVVETVCPRNGAEKKKEPSQWTVSVKAWVCPERNWMAVKSIRTFRVNDQETRSFEYKVLSTILKDGVWFPGKGSFIAKSNTKAGKVKSLARATLTVKTLALNDLQEKDFRFLPPEKITVRNLDTHLFYDLDPSGKMTLVENYAPPDSKMTVASRLKRLFIHPVQTPTLILGCIAIIALFGPRVVARSLRGRKSR